MSLSTQRFRGVLAVPLLLLFGVLVLLAVSVRTQAGNRTGIAPASAGNAVCVMPLPRASAWRFALTPADLGGLVRHRDSCRA